MCWKTLLLLNKSHGFAEKAKQKFPKFLEIAKENKQSFAEFDPSKEGHRLDTFYWKHIESVSSVEKVAEVLKIILTLSHGQASVERGFSINKSLLVENLTETSLISQKIVLDHLRSKDVGSENFEVCGKLRKSVRRAGGKYGIFLDNQRTMIRELSFFVFCIFLIYLL